MSTDSMFRMTVEDVFSIRGRGTVVTGTIEQGSLEAGDVVQLRGQVASRQVVVTAIEKFRRRVKQAGVGERVGLVLADIAKDDVQRGEILAGNE